MRTVEQHEIEFHGVQQIPRASVQGVVVIPAGVTTDPMAEVKKLRDSLMLINQRMVQAHKLSFFIPEIQLIEDPDTLVDAYTNDMMSSVAELGFNVVVNTYFYVVGASVGQIVTGSNGRWAAKETAKPQVVWHEIGHNWGLPHTGILPRINWLNPFGHQIYDIMSAAVIPYDVPMAYIEVGTPQLLRAEDFTKVG